MNFLFMPYMRMFEYAQTLYRQKFSKKNVAIAIQFISLCIPSCI